MRKRIVYWMYLYFCYIISSTPRWCLLLVLLSLPVVFDSTSKRSRAETSLSGLPSLDKLEVGKVMPTLSYSGWKSPCCSVLPQSVMPSHSYLPLYAIQNSHLVVSYLVSRAYISPLWGRAGEIISRSYCLGQKYDTLFGNHHCTFFVIYTQNVFMK